MREPVEEEEVAVPAVDVAAVEDEAAAEAAIGAGGDTDAGSGVEASGVGDANSSDIGLTSVVDDEAAAGVVDDDVPKYPAMPLPV